MSSMDDQNDIDAPFEGTFHIIPIYSPALIRPRPHRHFKANTRVCRTDAVPRAALSLPLSPSSPPVHQSPSRTSSLASLPPTRSSPSVRSHVAMSLPLLCRRPSTSSAGRPACDGNLTAPPLARSSLVLWRGTHTDHTPALQSLYPLARSSLVLWRGTHTDYTPALHSLHHDDPSSPSPHPPSPPPHRLPALHTPFPSRKAA
jgi:hypothetical protein